jgi:hypothetical protein
MKPLFLALLITALLPLATPHTVEAKTLDEKLKERLAEAERLGREADKEFRLNYYNNFITEVVIERRQAKRLVECDNTQENYDYLASLPTVDTKVDSYDDIPEEYKLTGQTGNHDHFWKTKLALTSRSRDFRLITKLQTCEKAKKADAE